MKEVSLNLGSERHQSMQIVKLLKFPRVSELEFRVLASAAGNPRDSDSLREEAFSRLEELVDPLVQPAKVSWEAQDPIQLQKV